MKRVQFGNLFSSVAMMNLQFHRSLPRRIPFLLRPAISSFPSLLSRHFISSHTRPCRIPAVPSAKFAATASSSSSLGRALDSVVSVDGGLVVLPSSVYIHIPFCRRRCFYCDFPIVAVGERTASKSAHMDAGMTDYVDLVCREISVAANVNACEPLKTVFFGGGTPSLLPPALVIRIINTLDTHFGIDPRAEISMEMDPGTFDVHSLGHLMEGGLNRVSMGVQSFQAELLKSCGRAHGLGEVYDAIEAIRASGLSNWSLDLISSLPNQTLEQWEHSIKEAIAPSPSHISVYDLQIEEGTLFNKWYKAGQFPLPGDEKSAEFYKMASGMLQDAGFVHYEISNYAKEGYQCRHNLVYWKNLPYFAFGLGSTSYVGGQRFSRPRKFKEYSEFVEKFEGSEGHIDCPRDSKEESALEMVMLSLRLARGLNIRDFVDKFGVDVFAVVCKTLLPFVSSGHVVFTDVDMQPLPVQVLRRFFEDDIPSRLKNPNTSRERIVGFDEIRVTHVRLTDPTGFLLSNEVIASIFSALPSGGSYLLLFMFKVA